MASIQDIESDVSVALRRDRHRFRETLRAIKRDQHAGKPFSRRLDKLAAEVERSVHARKARQLGVPQIRYDEDLPISARRGEIAEAIRAHQVVIVSGETGSGKSTQLPKICLELGRGIDGFIGHTQPRRIAARSVAARIADELHSPLGRDVGYKVRFAEALGPNTYIKLMTDGVLLAESQGDPYLNQYDTIILDEAHERSLNIDFLLGLLKRLLVKRRDLKLIITSATLETARFAEHFATADGPAPVIEVSGRTYPVEIRYRPLVVDEGVDEPDREQAVLDAVDEVAALGRGDILVFMPTERDIHETAKQLRGHALPGDSPGRATEILPLYARLSMGEQQRVFQAHNQRRIVIATNVAESSLTVPGIHYVVDPGTARVSRYNARTKTQRLPVEPVSQASADQRAGRCGRVAPGVCIRLFDEKDYAHRDRYTPPEIQRTNLASVILQTKAFGLGPIEEFPFLDPPRLEAVRDGYKTLVELGALTEEHELTEIGRELSRLPVDPRIGRMILAGYDEDCLAEVLVIASALEMQDPRERPLERQEDADAAQARFVDPDSDFLSYLKLWDFYHKLRRDLSRSQLRKACKQNFLSLNRLREWADIHRELLELVQQAGLEIRPRRDQYDPIHRAILTGLLSNLAFRRESNEYNVAGGGKAHLWPGSGTLQSKPKWLMAAELVETTRRYMRCCARVNPRWIEPIAGHLIKRHYSNVRWSRSNGSVMADERVTLFGLTIVAGRRVRYGPLDPELSRQLLIQHGLVEGDIEPEPAFLADNRKLLADMERLQSKLRRQDLLLGEWALFDFYDRNLPRDAFDVVRMTRWLRKAEQGDPRVMRMSPGDLLRDEVDAEAEAFPDVMPVSDMHLPLAYEYRPGEAGDGVTLVVPLEALNQLDPRRIGWLVPGLFQQKVEALIRSLPKELRRPLVPVPDTAKKVLSEVRFGEGDLRETVAGVLSRIAGLRIPPEAFSSEKVPPELQMNVRVIDQQGGVVSESRDVDGLRRDLGVEAAKSFSSLNEPEWTRDGLTSWDFEDLPEEVDLRRGGLSIKAYPMLVDRGDSVSLRLAESAERAAHETLFGLRRFFFFTVRQSLQTQTDWFPNLNRMILHAVSLRPLDLRQQLAELIAQRAYVTGQPIPRTRADFQRQLGQSKKRVGFAVQEVVEVVGPLLEAYHQARLVLDEATNPKWAYATDDIHSQFEHLLGPSFLTETPWPWLQQYRRYFRALHARLENLTSGGLIKDQRNHEQVRPFWEAYLERIRGHQQVNLYDPQLVSYRWLVEEYRVSIFAQKLGTAVPVSSKRLQEQWVKVK